MKTLTYFASMMAAMILCAMGVYLAVRAAEITEQYEQKVYQQIEAQTTGLNYRRLIRYIC